jgi:hypothetical protein
VRERQLAQLTPEELGSLRSLITPAQTSRTIPVLECEQETLTHAMSHIFERQSVVAEHELLAAALSQRQGEVDLPRLKRQLRQLPSW